MFRASRRMGSEGISRQAARNSKLSSWIGLRSWYSRMSWSAPVTVTHVASLLRGANLRRVLVVEAWTLSPNRPWGSILASGIKQGELYGGTASQMGREVCDVWWLADESCLMLQAPLSILEGGGVHRGFRRKTFTAHCQRVHTNARWIVMVWSRVDMV